MFKGYDVIIVLSWVNLDSMLNEFDTPVLKVILSYQGTVMTLTETLSNALWLHESANTS